jgi:uncharacterized membrane protein
MSKLSKNLKIISYLGIILSLLGLGDSIYLTIAHYTSSTILTCPESKFINCARVTTSQYSSFHGIPIVIFGLLFFLVMLVLQLPTAWKSELKFIKIGRIIISLLGLISVFSLVYIELYKLDAICLYCTGIHLITFALFVTTVIGMVVLNPAHTKPSTDNL